LPIGLFEVLVSCVPDQGQRNEEQDKGAADATCVRDEFLRVLLEKDNYDDWDRYDDAP